MNTILFIESPFILDAIPAKAGMTCVRRLDKTPWPLLA
jgi:hypothetical protein